MQRKQTSIFPFKGINKDSSVARITSEEAFDIRNMRIVTDGSDNGNLCLTNEKGNKLIKSFGANALREQILKVQTIGVYAIIFTRVLNEKSEYWYNRILRYSAGFTDEKVLYSGKLNLGDTIDSLGIVESESIQKVYWVDGINQPRVIDILKEYSGDTTQFNFAPNIEKNSIISATPIFKTNGLFSPGVIQYAISFYKKNLQQSPIVSVSPLYYICSSDGKGLIADGSTKTSQSFNITIVIYDDLPKNYDFIRLYRIQRSSLDTTPSVESIKDIPLNDFILDADEYECTVIDNGIGGTQEDPTELLLKGNSDISASTLDYKDESLFLGNVKLRRNIISKKLKTEIKKYIDNPRESYTSAKFVSVKNPGTDVLSLDDYSFDSSLQHSNDEVTHFKCGETYRFGIQLQDKLGNWSDVIFIGDYPNDIQAQSFNFIEGLSERPVFSIEIDYDTLYRSISEECRQELNNYVNIRPVCVYPTINDRTVLCQGILCPTVYNANDRKDNSPYVQSSWFARPLYYGRLGDKVGTSEYNSTLLCKYGVPMEHRMIDPNKNTVQTLPDCRFLNGEIYGARSYTYNYYSDRRLDNLKNDITGITEDSMVFGIDKRILTIHSPELDTNYNEDFLNLSLEGTTLKIVGYAPVKHTLSDVDIEADTIFNPGAQFNNPVKFRASENNYSGVSMVNYPLWIDNIGYNDEEVPKPIHTDYFLYGAFPVYPWQKSGSLTNRGTQSSDKQRSVLVRKTMSNLRFCFPTRYIQNCMDMDLVDARVFNSNEVVNLRLKGWGKEEIMYRGNYDKVLTSTAENSLLSDTLISSIFAKRGASEIAPIIAANDSIINSTQSWSAYFNMSGKTVILEGYDFNNSILSYYPSVAEWVKAHSKVFVTSSWDPAKNNLRSNVSIGMSYKSTSHGVLVLPKNDNQEYQLLPRLQNTFSNDEENAPYDCCVQQHSFLVNTTTGKLSKGEASSSYYNKWTSNDEEIPLVIASRSGGNNIGTYGSFLTFYSGQQKICNFDITAPEGYKIYSCNLECYSLESSTGLYITLDGIRKQITQSITYFSTEKDPFVDTLAIKVEGPNIGVVINRLFIVLYKDGEEGELFYINKNIDVAPDNPKLKGFTQNFIVLSGEDYNNNILNHGIASYNGYYDGYYYLIGELRRTNVINRFGGTTEQALANNTWCVCGNSVPISNNIVLSCTQGDTYYQRYDHLKTYPFSSSSVNNIVEIVSFGCETRINIDGRYDHNRGLESNLHVTPQNFNLFNPVYSQKNNFFNAIYLDSDELRESSFPSQIWYSLNKTLGEAIDSWVHILPTSFLTLDSNKGKVTAIRKHNNELYAIQDKAVSRILYNNRVQIQSSDNVPIEISNSNKVTGKVYISNIYGCQNLESVGVSELGIYFVDNIHNSLAILNKDTVVDLSNDRGLYSWIASKGTEKIVANYDELLGDMYFTSRDEALAFNEKLKGFSSFYNYGGVKQLFTFDNSSYQVFNSSIYELHGGPDYTYFETEEPFSISFIENNEFNGNDKIYESVEFQTNDTIQFNVDSHSNMIDPCPLSSLEVENDYQYSQSDDRSLKKKFRTWRWLIGRDTKFKRDRIRDHWAKFTIHGYSKDLFRIYNLGVNYYL